MFGNITNESDLEKQTSENLVKLLHECPIPDDEILGNLGLFLNSKNLSRILFFDYLYKKIIDTQGIIIDFGTRWGNNASIFSALRGIYEPFNSRRKILAFDTFKGFINISQFDGKSPLMNSSYLDKILTLQDSSLTHIKKHQVIEGNAVTLLRDYLRENPETIISLAYFDFDLFEPTKECLKLIKPYLFKGSVLGFDELNDHDSPGETLALKEVYNLNEINLKRFRYTSRTSYFIVG
jgi:hypothetical protein